MNPTEPKVIISVEGFAARGEFTHQAEVKTAKLRRHRLARIGDLRLHVKRETPHDGPPFFVVTANAESSGPDYIAHGRGAEPEIALNAAFERLERAIADTAGVRKHNRHQQPAGVIAGLG